ncbi:RNA polymerase sigma factor [Ktedonosporobacter rubrisoli]|uniref:RNA polymerase sigma factor n=1 Tax=Ktedonosporobacter rubrisoli TaxID=2509675 RepID=A0A4P6JXS7_KTERU|nr:RNA polymerase sigma factor [Ktedonosporobacter rubrisoli]QBD80569.1 RNA polymerase sigma factor [Ktedonosporobacter rubrisoli]
METRIVEETGHFISAEERSRLLQLCASVVGNKDVAEDLVQETLLEAWRHADALRDPGRRTQWLNGIARNVCLRWLRKRGKDMARLVWLPEPQDAEQTELESKLADDVDIEVELERKELVSLLDRALSLLPEETRLVLVKRYVDESPLAEIASQLGLNANALAMRLHRGKLALRRVLTTEMQQEIEPYAVSAAGLAWEVTPLWCPACGNNRLLGIRDPEQGELLLKCPQCSPGADEAVSTNQISALKGIKSYKPLYARHGTWCHRYYYTALDKGSVECEDCGTVQPVTICHIDELPEWMLRYPYNLKCRWEGHNCVVNTACPVCQMACTTSLEGLTMSLPAARQFYREHQRIRTLPTQEVETEGRRALVVRFESVTANELLTVVTDYTTYKTLRIERGSR